MLERIRNKEANGIISWNPDRLARNSLDGGQIIYLIDQGLIKYLKFPTFWFEDTPQGRFMLNLAFSQAKYYVDNLSVNVKRGMLSKARRGEFPMKAPPGYVNNRLTKKIDLNPKTAKHIKKAFWLYSKGTYSYQQISDYLKSKGVLSKRRKKRQPMPFAVNGIYGILTNPFYYGDFRFNDEIFKGIHKPLISKKLFDQVQGVNLTRSRNRKRIHGFTFTNLIKCSECGYMITAEKHRKYFKGTNRIAEYVHYRCTKKGKIKCSQPFLNQDDLVEQVNDYIKQVSIPRSWKTKMLEKLEEDKKEAYSNVERLTRELNNKLSAIQMKLDKLLDSYLEGIVTKADYLKSKDQLFSQKQDIQAKIEQFQKNQIYWLEPLKNHILLASSGRKTATSGSLDEKREVLKSIGSNFSLNQRKLTFNWQKPWARLSARATIRNYVIIRQVSLNRF
jgi:site-specific DNA recombinase